MATARSKSGLSESSNNKNTPSTPRVSKVGRAGSIKSDLDSPSPRQNLRLSVDRSPSSVESKPAITRLRTPNITSSPAKQARVLKGSELQAQLTAIQEDLKKAKEQLAFEEKEKSRALEELKEAKKSADEAVEKLTEAHLALKKAEESSEIEKFRADELEQAGIEVNQKRESEWWSELRNIKDQHDVDVAALLSTTQELQRVKQELVMTNDAKNTALSHAEDAMKIAEINAGKVEILSGEIGRLKSLLDAQLESKTNEAQELVRKLDSEIAALKQELEKAKKAEEKLVEMEVLVEGLKMEVNRTKKAGLNASNLIDELRRKVEALETRLEESNRSEQVVQDCLANTRKELEEKKVLFDDTESEIASLRVKLEGLELELARNKEDLENSNKSLSTTRHEALEMGRTVEVLKSELQKVEDEKQQALHNEKDLSAKLERLLEEKNRLLTELRITRDEGEEVRKAMEGLTSALHEVSTEAREAQERFLVKEVELNTAHAQIEESESALKQTKELYECRFVEAKEEIESLKKTVERSEVETDNSRAEWNAKELSLLDSIKKSEEKICTMNIEIGNLAEALKGSENEVCIARQDQVELQDKLRQVETEASMVNESMEEVKAENLLLKGRLVEKENEMRNFSEATKENELQLHNALRKAEQEAIIASKAMEEVKTDSSMLKERLLDKENELQSITQENDDLRTREATALQKIKELSARLTEATPKKTEEKVELTNGGKEHELLPEEYGPIDLEEKSASEIPLGNLEESFREETALKEENVNGNTEETKVVEVAKDSSSEREHEAESVDDELDSKIDRLDHTNGFSCENVNGSANSPTKQQHKKKKPLLQKFGSLLKKKNTTK